MPIAASTRLAACVVALTLVCAAGNGCKEDDPGGTPPTPDGGPIGLGDGGGSGGPLPDATLPSDTGVSVTVRRRTQPVADVRVVLHDESGAVTGELRTDANGVAMSTVAPKQLTVIHMTGAAPFLTYVDVAEGDRLAVDIVSDPSSPATPWANLSVNLFPNPGAVTEYVVQVWGCGGVRDAPDTSNPFVVPVREWCPPTDNAVLATAYLSNNVIGFIHKKGIPLPTQSSTVTVAPEGLWAAPKELRIKVLGAPDDADDVRTRADVGVNGLMASLDGVTGNATGDGDVYWFPDSFAEEFIARVEVEANGSRVAMASRAPSGLKPGEAGTGNKSATFLYIDALPRITQKSAATTTARRPEATWTIDGPLGNAAGGIAYLQWEAPTRSGWAFVIPPDRVTGIKAPELPADQVVLPSAGAQTVAQVTFYKSPAFQSPVFQPYRAFKKVPLHPPHVGHRDEDVLTTSEASMTSTSR